MKSLLLITYYSAFFLYEVAFAFHLLRRNSLETASALLALTANGAALMTIAISSGHMPVFNLFESCLLAIFILGLLGLLVTQPQDPLPDVRTWVWGEVSLLLVITLFSTKGFSAFQYDHDYLYIILFHGLRFTALSVALFSSAHFLQFRIDRKQGLHSHIRFHRGRNFLMLSAVLFLGAEYVGIVWCQNGWGDFWMWNSGFFQSTLIVLYFMFAFHIPGKGRLSEGIRSLTGGLSGFVMLILLVLRSLQ